jgi:hypothetical protein
MTGFVSKVGEAVHTAGEISIVSCNTKPGTAGDQEMIAFPSVAAAINRVGALGCRDDRR